MIASNAIQVSGDKVVLTMGLEDLLLNGGAKKQT